MLCLTEKHRALPNGTRSGAGHQ